MSRLQGKLRNRRGPTRTFFGRVARGKGEPKPTAINACRESDLRIVVMKHVEHGYPCECVERRGRPAKDHEGVKGEPYAEMEGCLLKTPTCAGSGASQQARAVHQPCASFDGGGSAAILSQAKSFISTGHGRPDQGWIWKTSDE